MYRRIKIVPMILAAGLVFFCGSLVIAEDGPITMPTNEGGELLMPVATADGSYLNNEAVSAANEVVAFQAQNASETEEPDTDGDGVPDIDDYFPEDPTRSEDDRDFDGDGTSDQDEIDAGTNPRDPTSFPGSGPTTPVPPTPMPPADFDPTNPGLNDPDNPTVPVVPPKLPNEIDIDGDGVTDGIDTNNDGDLDDPDDLIWEDASPGIPPVEDPTSPVDSDYDGDSDADEAANGTDPNDPDSHSDSDGDGLSDGLEDQLGTDPNNPDTDGDGLRDNEDGFPTNGIPPVEDPTSPVDSDGDVGPIGPMPPTIEPPPPVVPYVPAFPDINNDGIPDWVDSDGDGVWDIYDVAPFNPQVGGVNPF